MKQGTIAILAMLLALPAIVGACDEQEPTMEEMKVSYEDEIERRPFARSVAMWASRFEVVDWGGRPRRQILAYPAAKLLYDVARNAGLSPAFLKEVAPSQQSVVLGILLTKFTYSHIIDEACTSLGESRPEFVQKWGETYADDVLKAGHALADMVGGSRSLIEETLAPQIRFAEVVGENAEEFFERFCAITTQDA